MSCEEIKDGNSPIYKLAKEKFEPLMTKIKASIQKVYLLSNPT